MTKARVYEILELATKEDDHQSKLCDRIIISLIFFNVVCLILETLPNLTHFQKSFFYWVEVISVGIFTLEYLIRFWVIESVFKYKGIRGHIKFIFSPIALIDLMAILPFYLFVGDGRILRVFRIFRILKMIRYSKAMKDFLSVISSKKEEFVACGVILTIYLIFSSCVMYFLEHGAQPETFSSIPSTMWWSVVTLTTVGYGDMAPVTSLGKIIGAFIAVSGIGLFALPTCILGASFIERIVNRK